MKKFLTFGLTLLMFISLSVTAFAAPGEFVSSPSGKEGPVISDFEPITPGCGANLVLTPYGDRAGLDSQMKADLETAYGQIAGSSNLVDICEGLEDLAKDNNFSVDSLAVSDLFNVHYTDCESHGDHEGFKVTLSAEALENFVGVMYITDDGWKLFDGAVVSDDDETLSFNIDSLPKQIAIVVGSTVPATGDSSNYWIYIVIMALSAVAVLSMVVYSRKRTA